MREAYKFDKSRSIDDDVSGDGWDIGVVAERGAACITGSRCSRTTRSEVRRAGAMKEGGMEKGRGEDEDIRARTYETPAILARRTSRLRSPPVHRPKEPLSCAFAIEGNAGRSDGACAHKQSSDGGGRCARAQAESVAGERNRPRGDGMAREYGWPYVQLVQSGRFGQSYLGRTDVRRQDRQSGWGEAVGGCSETGGRGARRVRELLRA